MIWWQYLLVSIVPVCVGAVLGFLMSQYTRNKERAAIEQRQFLAAISAIAAEVKDNKSIAQTFTGRLLRFSTDRWDIHRAHVYNLPMPIPESVSSLYVQLRDANTIVDLQHAGQAEPSYCEDQYLWRCNEIAKLAAEVEYMLQPFISS